MFYQDGSASYEWNKGNTVSQWSHIGNDHLHFILFMISKCYSIKRKLNEYFEQRKNSFCNFGPYSKPFGDKDVVLYSN